MEINLVEQRKQILAAIQVQEMKEHNIINAQLKPVQNKILRLRRLLKSADKGLGNGKNIHRD